MRPTWSGMISFGLVNIPVGLYPATEDKDLSFHLLHKDDLGKIKNQRICTVCNKVVSYSDLVKGFEYEKGDYVVMTDEDFKSAAVPSTDSIAIQDFVAPNDINPIFYETPYYVKPDKKSATAYSLLYKALKETRKVGIAKVAFRTKERLAALVAGEDALVLYTMHFADEVRQAEAVPAGGEVGERELKMAEMLIETMSGKFEPDKYHDTYTEALKAAIESKHSGREVKAAEHRTQPTNIIDLMEILKASIEKSEKEKEPGGEPAPARTAASKPARKPRAKVAA